MWQSHPKYVQEIDAYVLLTFGWLFPFFPQFVQLFAPKVEKQPKQTNGQRKVTTSELRPGETLVQCLANRFHQFPFFYETW